MGVAKLRRRLEDEQLESPGAYTFTPKTKWNLAKERRVKAREQMEEREEEEARRTTPRIIKAVSYLSVLFWYYFKNFRFRILLACLAFFFVSRFLRDIICDCLFLLSFLRFFSFFLVLVFIHDTDVTDHTTTKCRDFLYLL